ncbi:hypothetical protein P3X46_017969 [Hevea brasiliensis]|uniref:Uncharacterized protein n=1 Tax=Hevea brasiliensis TaxID=3981 RepID=A0ABQ9LPB1_HEVBR|nr:hypothetical protein P3X46_017969 [Hevea brasiliensis]
MEVEMSLEIEEKRDNDGPKAATIACVVEVLENMVFLSNATNFVAYFVKSMHYPAAEVANAVTNFLGDSFLLAIFGRFISGSSFTRFKTFIVFCTIDLLKASYFQAVILCTGLYAIATELGGVKASLPAHGADQLDHGNQFLDKALVDDTISAAEVEETKTFLGLLPIFASTIMMNRCLAQLHAFSVQEGSIMNRKLHKIQIPIQSATVFSLTIILASIPLYEHFRYILKNKVPADHNSEPWRREAAEKKVILFVFWLGWQCLLLGVSDMLILGGMLEFFYSEAPESMRSICTALSWCSASMGFFLSSVLVSMTNSVTSKLGHQWLGIHL